MPTSLEQITAEREAREAHAASIAATLEPGDYFAYDNWLVRRNDNGTWTYLIECASHWDACLIMIAKG